MKRGIGSFTLIELILLALIHCLLAGALVTVDQRKRAETTEATNSNEGYEEYPKGCARIIR